MSFVARGFQGGRLVLVTGGLGFVGGNLRRTLGFEPKVSLREGLARALEFYAAHREHYL